MARGSFQHYVPRFLLREFGHGKKGRETVHVYDKKTGQEFTSKISEVGAESGFYDLQGFSMDEHLKPLEVEASRAVHKIVRTKSLRDVDRPLMALFVAVQELRTAAFRSKLRRLAVELAEHCRSMGVNPARVKQIRRMDEESIRVSSLDMIARAKPFSVALLQLDWYLFEVPPGHNLYTSDAPVVRQNSKNNSPFFSMGLVSDGIEVYLPLGEKLVLAMLCPSYGQRFMTQLLGPQPWDPAEQTRVQMAIRAGLVLPLSPENIERLNSLQAFQARRFIFSSHGGFRLARRMAAVEPEQNHALVADQQFQALQAAMEVNPRRGIRSRGRLRTRPGVPSIWRSKFEV